MQNLKENIDKLNKYLNSKNYDEIDIVDLVKYIVNNYGAGLDINLKKKKILSNILLLSLNTKLVFVLVDGLGYYKVRDLKDSYLLKQNLKSSIQTVNPTSTACVLSSIASASYPSKHGIFRMVGIL